MIGRLFMFESDKKSRVLANLRHFPMSVHMRRNLHLLRALQKGKPQLRKAILKHAERSCIKAICDCVLTILTDVVKLSAPQKRRLAKYKNRYALRTCG